MADNYLEKKMEELHSGKYFVKSKNSTLPTYAGKAVFDFPVRRVIIVGNHEGYGETAALRFLKIGCKVAFFDNDKENGNKLAHDNGVRYHEVDISDSYSVKKSFSDLLKAWRDVDIVIMTCGVVEDVLSVVAEGWMEHKHRYPILSDYGGRFIICGDISPVKFSFLNEFGIRTNTINKENRSPRDIANMTVLLSLKESAILNNLNL